MTRFFLVPLTFLSIIFFPWPFSAALALATSFFMPIFPLIAGLFADTLYYTPGTEWLPFCTIFGALAAGIAFFVRRWLSTGIIRE